MGSGSTVTQISFNFFRIADIENPPFSLEIIP